MLHSQFECLIPLFCLPDCTARIFYQPPYATAGIRTHVSRVAPTQDPTELPRHGKAKMRDRAREWERVKVDILVDVFAKMNKSRNTFVTSGKLTQDRSCEFPCANTSNKQPMFFLKMGQPQPLFRLFSSFRTENSVASRIQTRIVRVEGKNADH